MNRIKDEENNKKIKTRSCFSTNMDPYRAGIEIGEALAGIHPEVIFLFPTIHYNGSPELVEAIYEVLDPEEPVLIGNTGDGFYERNRVANVGVSALGIHTGGSVKWHLASESGLGKTPFDATKRCISSVNKACKSKEPKLYFLAADFRTDACEIIKALQENAIGPVVGGLAGDNIEFQHCFVYANRRVLTDSIAVLAIEGEVAFEIRIANQFQPIGRTGVITESEGTTVKTIDGIPATSFIEKELGKPLETIDQGITTFKMMDGKDDDEHRIRSLLLPDDKMLDSSIKLFGGVEEGNHVQLCITPPDRIIQDVKEIAGSLDSLLFKPLAALIVSCAGRKRVLAGNIEEEVKAIVQECKSLEALAGYPSFGEIGSERNHVGHSSALFHNMTFILLLIGEANQ